LVSGMISAAGIEKCVYARYAVANNHWVGGDKKERKSSKRVISIKALTENRYIAGEVDRIRDLTGLLCVYDINKQSFPNEPLSATDTETKISAICRNPLSPDTFFASTYDGIGLWDMRDRLRSQGQFGTPHNGKIVAHFGQILGLQSFGEYHLLSHGFDKCICLFDVRTPGKPIGQEHMISIPVSMAIYNSNKLIYGTTNGLYVYDVKEKSTTAITEKSKYIYSLIMDRNLLYAGDGSGRIDVFECNF